MSSLQPPLVGPRGPNGSPADLDGLLQAFFRAQMPEPWPVPKPPAMPSVPTGGALRQRGSLFRSRLALAASILILLIGQFFVSGMFLSYSRFAAAGDRGKTEATHRRLRSAKPAPGFQKPEAVHPPGEKGMLISGRR
jgi:hypothetical protein